VAVASAIAVGIMLDRYLEPWGTQKWAGLTLVLAAIAVFLARFRLATTAVALTAFVGVGGAWHHSRYSDMDPDDLALRVTQTGSPAWIRGVVREALGLRLSNGFGASDTPRVSTRFVLDLTEISDGKHWTKVSGRAGAVVSGDRSEIQAGQAIEAAGVIALLAPPLNPGEFDYRAFQRVEGVRLRFTVSEPQSFWRRPGGTDSWLRGLLGRIRSESRVRLMERLDPSVAPLAAALLLGQREGIEPDVNDAFARTGTTHLLAISGLQLQALAFALLMVFRVMGLARRPAYLGVCVAMVAYAVVVGPAPSVVRATVMTSAFCLAAISRRLSRPANTLALAALGTFAVNPSYLFDVGCQLSFLAIGALIWLVPPACALVGSLSERFRSRFLGPRTPLDELERRFEPVWRTAARRVGRFVIDGLVTSAVVWLAALPLVALRFHLVSPIGVILNVPLIPLTTAALLVGALGLFCSTIWGPLGAPLAWIAAWLLKATKAIVLWGLAQPWGHQFVVGPAWGWVLAFYVVLFLAIVTFTQRGSLLRRPHARWLIAGPWWLLAAWVAPAWLFSWGLAALSTTAEAEFLSVGHGLAVLIQTPDGQTFLYDCGRLGDPSVGRRIVAPALWERGVARLDAVFLSHADQDHFNALTDLLDRFRIGVVRITPGFGGEANPSAIDLLQRIRSRGVPIQLVTAPDAWKIGDLSLAVRHPPKGWDPAATDNARSIVLDVAYAGRHALLTGDLEQSGLEELVSLPRPDPPPEIMLAPHHGGRTANPEWLYEWARPRLVVASQRGPASTNNDVLTEIERLGIYVLRTWRSGAIRIRWTDDGIVARGFLDEPHKEPANPHYDRGQSEGGPTRHSGLEHRWPRWAWSQSPALRFLTGLAGFATGALACLMLAVVEIGAWALVLPGRSVTARRVAYTGLATADPEVDSIVIEATDGARLVARWFPAPGPGITGRTVLLLHGFAETSRALEASRAASLNRYGWNVAALDSRGHGQSEGIYSTFGGLEAQDIRDWLDELSARFASIDPALPFRSVLWGRSMGAAIALRAAALDSRPVALVLEAPMVDIVASTAAVLQRRRLPFPKLLACLIVRRAGKLAGMSIDRPGPVESAPGVLCSTAIIHGTEDPLVSIPDARRLAAAFTGPPQWFDIPGAKHVDVIDVGGELLLEQIAGFLEQASRGVDPEPTG
jgi:competence protein ComEC